MTLHPNSTLQGGKYKIEKVLGQGSFGITYLAEHTALTRKVAIKEFFMKELNSRSKDGSITGMSESSLSFNYAQKFRKEAQNLSRMDHPNIVRVTDSFEENGTFYYVMDYIEGENLNDYVKKHPLSEEQAISIIRDVAEALTYMHEKHHMLHLDLKPGNIMRRESDGHIFLIDFGLSKHYSDNGVPETSTSIGLGTAGYAPIEQSNQSKNGEFRPTVDVYALGATLYKLLTGETPPGASDVMNYGLPMKSMQAKGVSANTMAIIEKAMQFRARSRFQTIAEFVDAVNGISLNDSDVVLSSTDNEKTILDIQDKKTSVAKKKPSTKSKERTPKEESKVHRATRPASKNTKKSSNNSPKEDSNAGWLSNFFIIVATFLLVTWFFNWWPFLPKEEVANSSQVGQVIEKNGDRTFTVSGVSFTMVRVEGGTFRMGSNDGSSDEKPVHRVTLSSYYIGQTEVTQALWKAVMGSNPSRHKGNNLPVEEVSWEKCQTFITKLNQLTGQKFRLPTEAEWEYAARDGNKSKGYQYAGSNNLDAVAWHGDNSGDKTHPIATKQCNQLGLYDMSGNVWEWCQDCFGNYSSSSVTNPTGPRSGSDRVIRGGSWFNPARYCRVACRFYDASSNTNRRLGLRLAL